MEIANPKSVVILGTKTILPRRKSKKAAMQHTHDLLQLPKVDMKVDCADKHA
jgi:nitroimidazol reductase NimA-like FMN-containing flavoprotein (pyridoxamine 5'-phosphate oxidase superfamily)